MLGRKCSLPWDSKWRLGDLHKQLSSKSKKDSDIVTSEACSNSSGKLKVAQGASIVSIKSLDSNIFLVPW